MSSSFNHTPKMSISAMVIMKLGTDTNREDMKMNILSNTEPCLFAARMPSGIPMTSATDRAISPSLAEVGNLSNITSVTGSPIFTTMLSPMSPCSSALVYLMNWVPRGWS